MFAAAGWARSRAALIRRWRVGAGDCGLTGPAFLPPSFERCLLLSKSFPGRAARVFVRATSCCWRSSPWMTLFIHGYHSGVKTRPSTCRACITISNPTLYPHDAEFFLPQVRHVDQ